MDGPARVVPKEPLSRERFTQRRMFAKAARTGLEHFARHACSKDRPILLPAYIGRSPLEGSGVHDPIEASGRKYAFYRINEDLSADLADLEAQMGKARPSAVLVIHYFGFAQSDTARIRSLCAGANALLVEDCAHVFDSYSHGHKLGTIGDAAIFSIHKILPTPDGGVLQINRESLELPPLELGAACSTDTVVAFANADWGAIASRRKENYRALAELVGNIHSVGCLSRELPDRVTPMNLPVLIAPKLIGSRDRFTVYSRLRERGIEATSLYHTLIEQISPEQYPVSHDISRRILNLPIHQDVAPTDLERIAQELDRAVNG